MVVDDIQVQLSWQPVTSEQKKVFWGLFYRTHKLVYIRRAKEKKKKKKKKKKEKKQKHF